MMGPVVGFPNNGGALEVWQGRAPSRPAARPRPRGGARGAAAPARCARGICGVLAFYQCPPAGHARPGLRAFGPRRGRASGRCAALRPGPGAPLARPSGSGGSPGGRALRGAGARPGAVRRRPPGPPGPWVPAVPCAWLGPPLWCAAVLARSVPGAAPVRPSPGPPPPARLAAASPLGPPARGRRAARGRPCAAFAAPGRVGLSVSYFDKLEGEVL